MGNEKIDAEWLQHPLWIKYTNAHATVNLSRINDVSNTAL